MPWSGAGSIGSVSWAVCESMQENIHQAIPQQALLTKGMKVED